MRAQTNSLRYEIFVDAQPLSRAKLAPTKKGDLPKSQHKGYGSGCEKNLAG